MSNINKGKTGNVRVAGAIRSISDDNVAVYTGDVYDDSLNKNQRVINKELLDLGDEILEECASLINNLSIKIGSDFDTFTETYNGKLQDLEDAVEASLKDLSAESIKILNTNLLDVLGIRDSSTSSTNAVDPYILIYNPISRTFTKTTSVSYEYGTKVIDVEGKLQSQVIYGSSGGIDTSKGKLLIKVSLGSESQTYDTTSTNITSPGEGLRQIATSTKAVYTELDKAVTITLVTSSAENITTLVGNKTVTRTTNLNVVANNLLTASHEPYVIAGPEVSLSEEDYPSKSLSATLTIKAFQYMYIHRATTSKTAADFEGTAGKNGYLDYRLSSKGKWELGEKYNTPTLLYYIILTPEKTTLSNLYTTYLGANSSVNFSKLGTTTLQGATPERTAIYNVYQTKEPVAFGGGTMTFEFK